MRIHTTLSDAEIRNALDGLSGVTFLELSRHGSRKRSHAFEVKLTGNSPRNVMRGADKAATWDEWGIFLERLFTLDHEMIAGPYRDWGMFSEVTRWRFETLKHADQHRTGHRWEYAYAFNFECKCGARMTTEPRMRKDG